MEKRGILYTNNQLDCLPFYSQVSRYLENFLKGKELATKTLLKNFKFLKRGSNSPKLFIEDMRNINKYMIKLRTKHLKEARNMLSEKQILIWQYFVPRKPVNFYYACNHESGDSIERIFIDIDRQAHSSEDSRITALKLIKLIKTDKEFNKLLKFRTFIMWTGSSFHVYLLLKNKVDSNFYKKYLSYGNRKIVRFWDPENKKYFRGKETEFLEKWAESIKQKTRMNVKAGHAREKDAIILDSSNTPPGKLARAPFSLHITDKGEIDGIAVPVSEKELSEKDLIRKLKNLTPDSILKNMKKYAKLLR